MNTDEIGRRRDVRAAYQREMPHTFVAMQGLVMAMENVWRSAGKKAFFGYDKSVHSQMKFLKNLQITLQAMTLDGIISMNDGDERALEMLRDVIAAFASGFPNWPDAYEYARFFFGDANKASAIAAIGRRR